ncbi:MAG: hypothetical protein H6765_05385 [Candidatus Peribacteria bacterium]|nr:MAG: hypothetical protein H6765_05385 [Candidatus Peribacteria bacterium]
MVQTTLTPEHLTMLQQYSVDQKYVDQIPDVIVLILESKSIEDPKEKQNRFNLLPLMTDEQIDKLRGILSREKEKLAEIEQRYEAKKQAIKEKYMTQWTEEGYINSVSKIQEEESEHQASEDEEAENLLNTL